MRARKLLSVVAIFVSCAVTATTSNAVIFKRPVMARLYQYHAYTLNSPAVSIQAAASAIAGLNPSYVASTIRLEYGVDLTAQMISDFNTLRSAAPKAKFDIQLNLIPSGKAAYPNASALVAHMTLINSKVKLDGWWFDYLSQAQQSQPGWIIAAAQFAHSRGQTIGGNCDYPTVPPSADAVAFVDGPSSSSPFGYAMDASVVSQFRKNVSPGTAVLGHMHVNPQTGSTSEPCVFMNKWNSSERADFLSYWSAQQKPLGFTHIMPIWFPLCPGNMAYNSVADALPRSSKYAGQTNVYGWIKTILAKYN